MAPNKPIPDSTDSPAAAALSPLRWLMIVLAFLATVINYLDRQTLSVVAPELKEFGMSDATYGTILSAFMLAYTVMNGISGVMLDRLRHHAFDRAEHHPFPVGLS